MFGGRTRDRKRGQSNVISVVLLLGLTITGTGLIVAFGSSALDDSKRVSEIGGAEHAMTQLDSKASLVGVGDAEVQRVSLGFDSGLATVENDTGWLRIRVDPSDDSSKEVLNQTLGSVVYENGDTVVAYQGGGVWKRTDAGATMVSPPEVHYRDTTLTLPLVAVSGGGPLSGSATVRENGTADPKYPLAKDGFRNPLTDAEVNLTVRSDYYRAWGRFFEQRTGGTVYYDDDARTATLRLVTPPNVPEVRQGVASTSSQELSIQGSGGNEAFTNSYNSSYGPYEGNESDNGTIKTLGGVSLSGGAEIRGDLVSGGGEVEMQSSKDRIAGNLSYAGSTDVHKKATIGGWTAPNGSVPEIDPVRGMVVSKNESISADNDNGPADAVDESTNRLSGCDTTCTLTAGSYYLDEFHVESGDEVVFDLSGGTVNLAVSGPVRIDGGKVRVKNPAGNRVNVYMDAQTVEVLNGANVSVPGEKAGSFRVYGPPGVDALFKGGSRFVGMLYAPDSQSQSGSIEVRTQAEVFGALVGGKTTLQSGGVVHYDTSLATTSTLPPGYDAAPHVTYMHVGVNRVNVTSA